ncbi:MAG: methyltransferase domain-containing protein, partial [Myxococcota bacterium]
AGDRVLDLGSGAGPFPLQLARSEPPGQLRIVEMDVVREALTRTRERMAGRTDESSGVDVQFAQADLDGVRGRGSIPFRDGSVDAILLSLVLNYVADPSALLAETFRLLRPGGRMVLSSLKRDADISTICVDTIHELRSGRGRSALGAEGERRMGESLKRFINDAARLLDFEERGLFRFWDGPELAEMLRGAGYREVAIEPAFGDPPQALVARARRC